MGMVGGGLVSDQYLSRLVTGVVSCRVHRGSTLGPRSPLELLHLLVLQVTVLLMLMRAWPSHDPHAVLLVPNHGRPLG